MLVVPQPQATETTSHPLDETFKLAKPPVVDLSETRTTLEPLLRLCYPSPKAPTFSSFDDAKPLLEAAHKYDLAFAAGMLEHAIAPFVRDDPIRVHAFAARAGVYHRLLDYLSNAQGLTKTHKWTWRACTQCVKHNSARHQLNEPCGKCGQASWFSSFWDDVMARLKKRPSPVVLQDPALSDAPALKKALECARCREVVHEHMRKFLGLLVAEAETKISEVRLWLTPYIRLKIS
ncbi:hypothetical protein C8T65DRAFT_666631 [Cerioporus squamosus]|nr:hypothetical protein C8T65DRAFT_666631 [Cerioporus squamosus]